MKTIHTLEEHQSMMVSVRIDDEKGKPTEAIEYWLVTRVATGWIYHNRNQNYPTNPVFVPLTYYTNPNV